MKLDPLESEPLVFLALRSNIIIQGSKIGRKFHSVVVVLYRKPNTEMSGANTFANLAVIVTF